MLVPLSLPLGRADGARSFPPIESQMPVVLTTEGIFLRKLRRTDCRPVPTYSKLCASHDGQRGWFSFDDQPNLLRGDIDSLEGDVVLFHSTASLRAAAAGWKQSDVRTSDFSLAKLLLCRAGRRFLSMLSSLCRVWWKRP